MVIQSLKGHTACNDICIACTADSLLLLIFKDDSKCILVRWLACHATEQERGGGPAVLCFVVHIDVACCLIKLLQLIINISGFSPGS